MSPVALVYPVLVQAALTFVLAYWMGVLRYRVTASRTVRIKDMALGQDVWPERAKQIGNAFHNQLQMPILFYAVCAFAILTAKIDTVLVVLAWCYVAARLVHAYIHTTSNYVPWRFMAFQASGIALVLMWLWFGGRILAEGA